MSYENIQKKDICQKCKNYWLDFPVPFEYYESHCLIIDKDSRFIGKVMSEIVPFPCLECPFDSYVDKNN